MLMIYGINWLFYRLSFIDAKDFSRYSDLKKRALNWDDEYCWFGNDQSRFEIDGHEELRIMVSKNLY